jgi:hypothetical protein
MATPKCTLASAGFGVANASIPIIARNGRPSFLSMFHLLLFGSAVDPGRLKRIVRRTLMHTCCGFSPRHNATRKNAAAPKY